MDPSHDVLIVIPARLESSRLEKKLLKDICGRSVINHVCDRIGQIEDMVDVIVATDSNIIYDHVKGLGYSVEISEDNHINGTERVAEVARKLDHYKWIINVQGDEPFINVNDVRSLISELTKDVAPIVSMFSRIHDINELKTNSVVKVKLRANSFADDFSRIGFPNYAPLQHIGIYGFRREVLVELVQLPPTDEELARGLEQMRWLENGYEIKMIESKEPSLSIDTHADLLKARELYNANLVNLNEKN